MPEVPGMMMFAFFMVSRGTVGGGAAKAASARRQ
jgi:hypothetical protein